MNEWKTVDRVQFVVDKWSDDDKAALLAALLEDAGAVKLVIEQRSDRTHRQPSSKVIIVGQSERLLQLGLTEEWPDSIEVIVLPVPEDTC